jgi:proteasome lid subunit RPN8/RPN11
MAPEGNGLTIPMTVYKRIKDWAIDYYPHEGCGVLTGHFQNFENGGSKKATRFVPLKNVLLSERGQALNNRIQNSGGVITAGRAAAGNGRTEFLMDPAELNQACTEAIERGEDIVGIVHTHPDHPPRPSAMDSAQPMLALWSNVIIGIEKNGKNELDWKIEPSSWVREDENASLRPERLTLGEGNV